MTHVIEVQTESADLFLADVEHLAISKVDSDPAALIDSDSARPSALEFVCFDLRLAVAARKEGFRVVAARTLSRT